MTTATAKVPSEAEQNAANKEKLKKLEKLEANQAEDDAARGASPAPTATPAPAIAAIGPPTLGAKMATPRDRKDYEAARGHHSIVCPGVSPEEAQHPRYLWNIHTKLRQYDEVLMHDEAFRWEYRARIMEINKELQLVNQSLLAPVKRHDKTPIGAMADLSNMTIIHMGAAAKWGVMYGTSKIKDGFETREEAEDWIEQRRRSPRRAA